jgi:futalosine hydrolase
MQIVICAATPLEINPLQQYFEANKTQHDIQFLVHGIGLGISSAIISKAMVLNPDAIFIQIGVAGAFNPSTTLGEVFIIANDNIGDMGVTENGVWQNMEDLNLQAIQPKLFSASLNYSNDLATKYASMLNMPDANATTVNQITTAAYFINYFTTNNIHIETMEGAALHINGLLHKNNFLQLRGISNIVGERNKANWAMETAIKNVTKKATELINLL